MVDVNLLNVKKECVTLYPIKKFLKKIKDHFPTATDIGLDVHNRGVVIYTSSVERKLYPWVELASIVEWFDDAEIVTDRNERVSVMVWLNV